MKRKAKGIFKFLAVVGVVVIVALILMIPQASDAVAKWTGTTGERVRSVAQTIIGAGVGVMLIGYGVAALSVPILGGAMIVIGLVLLAWSLWPLFKPKSATVSGAGLSVNKAA